MSAWSLGLGFWGVGYWGLERDGVIIVGVRIWVLVAGYGLVEWYIVEKMPMLLSGL